MSLRYSVVPNQWRLGLTLLSNPDSLGLASRICIIFVSQTKVWHERFDANEMDQDSSKEQCVAAATDFIDFADSRGLKYSMQAKIPTMHVDVNVPAKQVEKEAVN
uniref:Uncharacterized protein n=1 Tax=Populus trichocarpa TaxID=3694 RepID=B9GHL7_POPTR